MFLVKLFSKLPGWFIYGLAEVNAFFIYYIFKYRRAVVRENLVNSFPTKTLTQIKSIEKKYYQNLLRIFYESIYSYGFTKPDWQKRITIENPELLTNILDNGTPVILMSGHFNNWEWAGSSISTLIDYPFEFMYKPMKNEKFGSLMRDLRQKHWNNFVNQETAFYVGAERIASLVGYSVYYMECERVKNGKYNIRFTEISNPPDD